MAAALLRERGRAEGWRAVVPWGTAPVQRWPISHVLCLVDLLRGCKTWGEMICVSPTPAHKVSVGL